MKRSIPQGAMSSYTMCVPSMGIFTYRKVGINLEGASPLWARVVSWTISKLQGC